MASLELVIQGENPAVTATVFDCNRDHVLLPGGQCPRGVPLAELGT